VRTIPDKLFFKIGEVAEIVGVEAYVLRFWQTEFPELAPEKTGSGHRVYRKKDVETVLRIKELLYERGFTIPGARKQLSRGGRAQAVAEPAPEPKPVHREAAAARARRLSRMRADLTDILTMLNRKPRVTG
jgi:DNA-binding transcriptional MerR regulator